MKVTVWVKASPYESTEVLNDEQFQQMKAESVKDMIDEDCEFAEWLNDNFTPMEVYTTSDEEILSMWKDACDKAWDLNDGDEWEKFEIEV